MYILAIIICVHGGVHRPGFKKLYLLLCIAVTDALRLMKAGREQEAAEVLRRAQQVCEELYIEAE